MNGLLSKNRSVHIYVIWPGRFILIESVLPTDLFISNIVQKSSRYNIIFDGQQFMYYKTFFKKAYRNSSPMSLCFFWYILRPNQSIIRDALRKISKWRFSSILQRLTAPWRFDQLDTKYTNLCVNMWAINFCLRFLLNIVLHTNCMLPKLVYFWRIFLPWTFFNGIVYGFSLHTTLIQNKHRNQSLHPNIDTKTSQQHVYY